MLLSGSVCSGYKQRFAAYTVGCWHHDNANCGSVSFNWQTPKTIILLKAFIPGVISYLMCPTSSMNLWLVK